MPISEQVGTADNQRFFSSLRMTEGLCRRVIRRARSDAPYLGYSSWENALALDQFGNGRLCEARKRSDRGVCC